jgi:hypothetical protein
MKESAQNAITENISQRIEFGIISKAMTEKCMAQK